MSPAIHCKYIYIHTCTLESSLYAGRTCKERVQCQDSLQQKEFIWLIWRKKMSVEISMAWLLGRTIYSAAYKKTTMGKNRVCREVRCLWRELINLLLLGCQFCGSAILCCTGTAEAVGGGVKGSFFKGQVFSPKQHAAQPCWWQLL